MYHKLAFGSPDIQDLETGSQVKKVGLTLAWYCDKRFMIQLGVGMVCCMVFKGLIASVFQAKVILSGSCINVSVNTLFSTKKHVMCKWHGYTNEYTLCMLEINLACRKICAVN